MINGENSDDCVTPVCCCPFLDVYPVSDIFVSFCSILRSAGHTEKAVSLFQALIELNLFCPEILVNESYTDRLEFLETFWDTPVGRLGENGAQGWAQYVESKGVVPPVEPWYKQGKVPEVLHCIH